MGDQCLFRIAAALQRSMGRGTDVLARWGGEEFVVLLAGTDVGGAKRVAQNLLTTVMGLGIQQRDGSSQPVTVSVGIAPLDAATLAEPRLWIQKADLALYESKRRGRNCATLSTELTVAK
jgi:diguanylate cyclase (GGDEF)-like protein